MDLQEHSCSRSRDLVHPRTDQPQKIGRLLRSLGYSLQTPSKTLEGTSHPDRNAQFEHINRRATEFIAKGVPVLSVDSKKKELVGEFKLAVVSGVPKGSPGR